MWLLFILLLIALPVKAAEVNFDKYFKVDMNVKLPDLNEYLQKIQKENSPYDKGYRSRLKMGNKFKVEFSRTIKKYGMSEGRIKDDYEDELLYMLSLLPKEMYQYVGPRMHEVTGMSEKILNLPGIKETKNKFPQRVAERMKKIENIEYLSPALYFLLMPEIWDETKPQDDDTVQEIPVKEPKRVTELPDFLKEKVGMKLPKPENKKTNAGAKRKAQYRPNIRTVLPTLTSPLTTSDAEAFVGSIDDIMTWGYEDDLRVISRLISAETVLDYWEAEQGIALSQNDLKDMVNPCQRLVLKIKFAGLYDEFRFLMSKYGYTPEQWAYVGDKTIKAFRVATASPDVATAVKIYRKGYFDPAYEKFPEEYKDEYYATKTAIIKMYAVFKDDVEAVRPVADVIEQKFNKISGMLLTSVIFY